MARILRFVAEDETTVRLDLNDPAGFLHSRRIDWGTPDVSRGWLGEAPYDGDVMIGDRLVTAQATIGLILTKQASFAAMEALHDSLATELNRRKNKIEWRPDGATHSYFIRTYRAPVPPMQRAQDAPKIETLLRDPVDIMLAIPRHPLAKRNGAAVFL